MRLASVRFRSTYRWLVRLSMVAGLLAINSSGIFGGYAVDGIAAATVVKPSVKLKLESTPKRNASKLIKVAEGETVNIHLTAIDSTDKKRVDEFKLHAMRVDVASELPAGAVFTNTCVDDPGNTCGEAFFSWTPQYGDADQHPVVDFEAYSSSLLLTSKQQWAMLQVLDNSAPDFVDGLPESLALTVDRLQKLDIVARPGVDGSGVPHRLKIVLDADTPLPKGAHLGRLQHGKDGNWHRILSWKPKAIQAGSAGSLRFYAENADIDASAAVLTQAEYALDYSVAANLP